MRNSFINSAAILFCFFGLSGCSEQVDSQTQVVKNTPTPKIAESKEETLSEGTVKSIPPMSSNPFALTKEEIEQGITSIIKDIRQDTKKFAKAANLPDMEKQFLAKNEIEFRFWIIDARSNLIGFVATQKKGENKAFEVVTQGKERNIEKHPLKDPETGWDNLWRYLESRKDIISKRDNRAAEAYLDQETFAIELKTNKDYMFALYSENDIDKGDNFLIDLCRIFSEDFRVEMCERKVLRK